MLKSSSSAYLAEYLNKTKRRHILKARPWLRLHIFMQNIFSSSSLEGPDSARTKMNTCKLVLLFCIMVIAVQWARNYCESTSSSPFVINNEVHRYFNYFDP